MEYLAYVRDVKNVYKSFVGKLTAKRLSGSRKCRSEFDVQWIIEKQIERCELSKSGSEQG
jgi:hypothetical protein